MTTDWSSQIEKEFAVRLPGDVADLFDGGLCRQNVPIRFFRPVLPEELLDRASHVVSGGAMLPDTLPILDNGFGDALCLRFAADGSMSEVVCWQHEGATWHPYGKTLAEAILIDTAMNVMEEDDDPDTLRSDQCQELVGWALGWMQCNPAQLEALLTGFQQPTTISDVFIGAGLAESLLRRLRCKRHWSSELSNYCRRRGGQCVADQYGMMWPDVARFCFFDTQFVPDKLKQPLARAAGIMIDDLLKQDWLGAAQEAERVALNRTDLAWPYAVLGWAAERNGDFQSAIRWYFPGLRSMATTADFTESWCLRDEYSNTKFFAERLLAHCAALPSEVKSDGLYTAIKNSSNGLELSDAIADYWRKEAALAERQSRPYDAYQNFFRAGWDLYAFDCMEMILKSLQINAKTAGAECLARIAQRHIESLP